MYSEASPRYACTTANRKRRTGVDVTRLNEIIKSVTKRVKQSNASFYRACTSVAAFTREA